MALIFGQALKAGTAALPTALLTAETEDAGRAATDEERIVQDVGSCNERVLLVVLEIW